jgi:hypothetical protein
MYSGENDLFLDQDDKGDNSDHDGGQQLTTTTADNRDDDG